MSRVLTMILYVKEDDGRISKLVVPRVMIESLQFNEVWHQRNIKSRQMDEAVIDNMVTLPPVPAKRTVTVVFRLSGTIIRRLTQWRDV